MLIRTYYWHSRIESRIKHRYRLLRKKRPNRFFKYGNCGDIFTKDLIEFKYNCGSLNLKKSENRLLCVGSIANQINHNDVICGIGVKEREVLDKKRHVSVFGCRGPITLDVLVKSGYSVNDPFIFDPGLLIKEMITDEVISCREPIFIPHYRERYNYGKKIRNIYVVDIDNDYKYIAKRILGAPLVFSSSLHGIIFSHSLGIPCVYIKPQTKESDIKFEDYFLSVQDSYKDPVDSIYSTKYIRTPDSPLHLCKNINFMKFPSIEVLNEKGIAIDENSLRI